MGTDKHEKEYVVRSFSVKLYMNKDVVDVLERSHSHGLAGYIAYAVSETMIVENNLEGDDVIAVVDEKRGRSSMRKK